MKPSWTWFFKQCLHNIYYVNYIKSVLEKQLLQIFSTKKFQTQSSMIQSFLVIFFKKTSQKLSVLKIFKIIQFGAK